MRKVFFLKGFTLTEVIIVLSLSVLIIVTVFSVYALSQRAYVVGEVRAEIIQNSRVISERLTREIRQAKGIISSLPPDRTNPPSEIKFREGHLASIEEQDTARGGGEQTIILALGTSTIDDYYKDAYIRIVSGLGEDQVRKITSYDGSNQTANVETSWATIPNGTSVYKIDTNFYYIHYYLGGDGIVWRKVSTFCLAADSSPSCVSPETYVAWDTISPPGQFVLELTLEEPRIIGEYVADLEFWGGLEINIFLTMQKNSIIMNLQTRVSGRNL